MSDTVGVDKKFGDFNINAFFGGNSMRRQGESISANGSCIQRALSFQASITR